MRKAIVIGATSGIGKALAEVLSQRGYAVGAAGRNEDALAELQRGLPGETHTLRIDVSCWEEAAERLRELIAQMGGVDLVVISSGIGRYNPELEWGPEKETIDVNVSGFVAMATAALRYFREQGHGHLVGISSIAGVRGVRTSPAYGASKAFVSNYLEALRANVRHTGLPIYVTNVLPGFVDTPMVRGNPRMFWVAPAEKAARQIADAIERRPHRAYITRRWVLIAWVARHLPDWLYDRI